MYLIIIILPLLGSVFSGFLGRKIGTTGAHIITCSCVITTTLLSIFAFIEVGLNNIPVSLKLFRWIDSESINILWFFHFDSLTVSMLIPVLIVSSLVHIYSISYMSHDPHNQRFFSYLSLFTFMMIILVTGNNLLVMFVGWEGVGVCSYLLVCFWYTRIWANQSSLSAFLTNRVGDTFLTIGMFAIIWSVGNLDYSTVFSLAPYISENIVTIIGICLLIGAMAKSSQVGLHVWLPMAMEGPTPVSALIHAATMVTAGVYLLMRTSPLIEYSSTVLILCLWLGATTTVFSSLIGLFQQDIKKVIAYSTMSQLGMMVIAIGLSSYNIALFHLVNHAFYKALLFLGAGSVIHSVADNQDFRKYGGLISFLPLTYSVMLIASLSLVAFPFMTGFYSKDFILESAYGKYYLSSISVYFIATIGAMFTTLYSVKVLYLTFLTNPNGPLVNYKNAFPNADASIQHNNVGLEGNIYMSLPLIILALFSIFFGYITKDLFIGLGTDFFIDNSVFIHPCHEIILDTEFSVPTIFKLLPLYLTILLSFISIIFSEFIPKLLVYFKFNRIGYNIFGFFNQRFLIELFYNKYITNLILYLGGQTTKFLDKGSVELVGPFGLEKLLKKLSKQLSGLNTGVITSYAVFILIGLIIYIELFYYTSYFKETVILQDNLSETLYQVGFNNSQVISYSLYFPPVFKYFICELNTKGFPWLLDGPLNNIHFIVMLYLILNSLLVYNFYIIRYFFEKNKLKKIFNNNIHYKTSVNSYINKNIAFVFLLYYMAGDSYNAVEITLYNDIFNNIEFNLINRAFGDGACTYLPLISSTSMINTSNNLFSYVVNFINFDVDFFIKSIHPNFNITLLSLYNSYLLNLSKLYGYIPIMLPVGILAINSIIYNFYKFIEILLSSNFINFSKYLDLSKLNQNISELEITSSCWEGINLKKSSVHSLFSDLPGYSVFSDPDSKLMNYTAPTETNLSVFMNTGMDTGINTDIPSNPRDTSPMSENDIMDENIQNVGVNVRNIIRVIYQFFLSLSINENTSSIWLRRLALISRIFPSFIIVLICLSKLDSDQNHINLFNEMQSLINLFTQLASYMDTIYINIGMDLDNYHHDAPDTLLGGLNTDLEDRSIFILRAILTELLNIIFNSPDFFGANDYINHTHGILANYFTYSQSELRFITVGTNILSFDNSYDIAPFSYTNINNYLGIDLTNVNVDIPHVWYNNNNFPSLANLNINNFDVTFLPNDLESTLLYDRMYFPSFYHTILGFYYHLNETIADVNNWLSSQGINISTLQNNITEFLRSITTETNQLEIFTDYDDEDMSFYPSEPDSDMEDYNQDYFNSDN